MIIQCNSCSTKFRLDDSRVSSTGVKVRCTKCQNVFIVWPEEHGEAPEAESAPAWAPEPGAKTHDEEPAAGASAGDEPEEEQSEERAPGEEEKEEEEGAPSLSFGDVDLSFIKKDAEGTVPEEDEGEEEDAGTTPDSIDEERNEWREAIEGGEAEDEEAQEDRDELLKALNEALVQTDVEGPGKAGVDAGMDIDLAFDEGAKDDTGPEIGPEDLGLTAEDAEEPSGPVRLAPDVEQETPEEEVSPGIDETPEEETHEEVRFPEEPLTSEASSAPVYEEPTAGTYEENVPPMDSPVETEDEAEEEFVFTAAPRGGPPPDFEDVLAGELGGKGTEDEAPSGAASAQPRSMGLGLLIVALIIIAGGVIIYSSGIIDKLTGSIVPGGAPKQKTVAIQNIDSYVAENKAAGRLLVVEAKIRNIMTEPQGLSGVRGTLYSTSGKKLAERTVSLGRVVSTEDLRNLSRAELLKQFSDVSGGTLPPRGTVPVMVIFEEIPEGTAEFGLEVLR